MRQRAQYESDLLVWLHNSLAYVRTRLALALIRLGVRCFPYSRMREVTAQALNAVSFED